jgi:hypothetical protein
MHISAVGLQYEADMEVNHLEEILPSKDDTLADLIIKSMVGCEDCRTYCDVVVEIQLHHDLMCDYTLAKPLY